MRSSFLRGAFAVAILLLILGIPLTWAQENEWIEVATKAVEVRTSPDLETRSVMNLYRGMRAPLNEIKITPEGAWYSFKVGKAEYWIQGEKDGELQTKRTTGASPYIIDSYGILDQPHRFAAKLVKYSGAAEGRLETYEKIDGRYILNNVYPITYRAEGQKTDYGDLKTVGGPVVRYMYRTMKTGMRGRDKAEEEFGVYKISYPMPHDALPHFLEGHMGPAGYNAIPVINEWKGTFLPHPKSLMGADILIHTARKGSRGCINLENEQMSLLYHEDLASENDREIIPLIIYDEEVQAPDVGELF